MTTLTEPTTIPGPLTSEQIEFFRANGFLHIPQLVPEHELEAVRRDTLELIQRGLDVELDDPSYAYGADAEDAGRRCLFRINDLISRFKLESVQQLAAYPPLLQAVQQAVGDDHFSPVLHSTVFKIPKRGYPVPWHQDGIDVHRFPVFNVDIYLDEATTENGCLYVIPGSHLAGYHGTPDFLQGWTHGKDEDAPGAIAVPTRPGDVLFHATSVLHGSFWNRSDSMRRTIYIHIEHLKDFALRSEKKRNIPEYMEGQKMTVEAIEARRKANPDETPFDFKVIERDDLDNAIAAAAGHPRP